MHLGNTLVGAREPYYRLEVEASYNSAIMLDHYLASCEETSDQANIETVNLCSAKQIALWFRRRKVDQVYLGFIRLVKDEKEQEIVPMVLEKTAAGCDVEKAFHEDMPKSIKAVLLNYKGIFPIDLPPGLPLVRMGHEYRCSIGKNPSTGTAQQRLFLVHNAVLHAVVVILEVLDLSTKSRCSLCCKVHL